MFNLLFAGIFAVFPLLCLFIAVIGLIRDPANWRRYGAFFVYFIFIAAYSYEPTGTPDLVRHFEYIEQCAHLTFSQTIRNYNSFMPIESFMYWSCAKLQMPHLLPGLAALCIYSVLFYITGTTAEYYHKVSKIKYIILLQLLMLPFISIISNTFNILSFALVSYSVYRDVVERKRNVLTYAIYVIACLTHVAGLVLVLLRILISPAKKHKILVVLGLFLVSTIINYSFQNLSKINLGFFGAILRLLISRVYWYLNDPLQSEYSIRIAKSLAQRIDRYTMCSLAILFMVRLYQIHDEDEKRNNFATFIFMVCSLTLAMFPATTPQYWRSAACTMIMVAAIVLPNIHERYRIQVIANRAFFWLLPVYMVMGLALQIWNSRYIIDYGQVASGVICTNIYSILYRFVVNFFSI